ncbi:MAG: YkvA family protein [Pseudomonadales bacterium]
MSEPPYTLARYQSRARRLLEQPKRLASLATKASAKAAGERTGERLSGVRSQLTVMLEMLKAWARGDYQGVSRSALLSIAGALLYFVAPFDAIPDFILGLGLIDDVAVIGFVVKQVQHELEAFQMWQQAQESKRPDEESPP